MSEAANNTDQVGTWKVGNKHIEDLLPNKDDLISQQINLVTKDEFNDEYQAWAKVQQPKAGTTQSSATTAGGQ